MWRLFILGLAVVFVLTGCGTREVVATKTLTPVMRWDHRPEAAEWTNAAMVALQSHGAALATLEPSDIATWCPAYVDAGVTQRNAFWAGLFSALAKHESTWNPVAVGGGGRWFGLVQIDPRTARGYDCAAKSGAALKDGSANLSCAVRIASKQVAKRGSIARGMRDWGPFHHAGKRAEMSAWTRAQDYCAL